MTRKRSATVVRRLRVTSDFALPTSDFEMPRFALLSHHHPTPGYPTPHFDLLLEDPGMPGEHRCRTWRLPADPRLGTPVPAEPLAPHRTAYLSHEGPVSGDRGFVERLDGGALRWDTPDPPAFLLNGAALRGRYEISGGALRASEPRP